MVTDSKAPGLAPRLRRASASELLRLVGDHGRQLTLREVRQILLNPYANSQVIEELGSIRRLMGVYEVRAALVRHPRTSLPLAMRLVVGLYWRELLAVATDTRISPAVRRLAEKYLIRRLPGMAVGERTTLARRVPARVIAHLRQDSSLRVIAALLENPRLTEELLLPLASDATASPRVLDLLAADGRWGRRYALRAALARNPRSPLRAVLAYLPILRQEDLAAVASSREMASIVRHRARQILAARPSPAVGEEAFELTLDDGSGRSGS